MPSLLHLGCGGDYKEGFTNCDRTTISPRGKKQKVDLVFELGDKFPFNENEIFDGIVSMHVFQQLYWRDLISCFRECYRLLKFGGVLRFGSPTVELPYDIDYLLGWNNVNLFSRDLILNVLHKVGFKLVETRRFGESQLPILATVDNRKDRGTIYFEAIK